MKISSQVYGDDVIKSRYHRVTSDLYHLLVSLHKGSLTFNYNGKVINAVPADVVRVVSQWSQSNSISLSLRNIIVSAVLSSENQQIGSGIICALALTPQGRALLELNEEKFRKRTFVEEDSLFEAIKYMVGSGVISKIAKKALKMGLMSSDVLRFNLTYHSDFILKQLIAQQISGLIHPLFKEYPKNIEAHILFIDGFIESLGEVDHFLQQCAELKINVVICAEGYGPDVITTLYQNWLQKRLFVFPFQINHWPGGSAQNYSQKMGIKCISTSTGHVLNTLTVEDLGPTFITSLEKNILSIEDSEGEEFYLEILSPGRFKPLMGLIEDRIRICQLTCRGIAEKGLTSDPEYQEIMSLIGFEKVKVSNSAIRAGISAAKSCKKLLNNMGAMIIVE